MATPKPKQRVKTLDDGVIESDFTIEDLPDRRVKGKRDHVSDRSRTIVKKLRVSDALEMQEDYEGEEETTSTEFASIEDDLLSEQDEPNLTNSDGNQLEPVDKDKTNSGLSAEDETRLKAYGKGKIWGDSKVLDGLKLQKMQRKFIISFCNPDSDTYNNKFESFIKAGYKAANRNSLISNVSKLLGNQKIKEGIEKYRREMITSKKFEISTETINVLRRRATYSIDTFYNSDGTIIPYEKIPNEWLCCVDKINRKRFKGTKQDFCDVEYQLCDRQKALDSLNKLLEIQNSLSGALTKGRPQDLNITAAVDAGQDKDGNQLPKVVVNMSLFED